jgi:hypothetical protein
MEKEFVPYELALRMKALGFDESCFACFNGKHHDWLIDDNNGLDSPTINPNKDIGRCVKRPIYSQAFRWFREKYFIHGEPLYKGGLTSQTAWYNYDIISTIDWDDSKVKNKQYKTYEEAETACLEKLLEIVEERNNE